MRLAQMGGHVSRDLQSRPRMLYSGEQILSSHGETAMPRMFQGKDRRMILRAMELLLSIRERDFRTQDPKPTRSLSTRGRIFNFQVISSFPGVSWKDVLDAAILHLDNLTFKNQGDPVP